MDRIYNEVAKRYNTTADEVEKEIAYALSVAKENPSPSARAFWGRIDDNADVTDVICNIVSRLALVV
jgi:hypothetical protein